MKDLIKPGFNKSYIQSAKYFLRNLPQIIHKMSTQKMPKRKSDTLYIFGSGYSINEIKEAEWERIHRTADTMGFNYFFRCDKIAIDYHIIREVGRYSNASERQSATKKYILGIKNNSRYSKTKIFLCVHPTNICGNYLFKHFQKNIKNNYVLYTNRLQNWRFTNPRKNLWQISHMGATLTDAINIGYSLGYKTIILAGVDLYDCRYFWLPHTETRKEEVAIRGTSKSDQHHTTDTVLFTISRWSSFLSSKGVILGVYNPKSLLSKALPIIR